MKKSAKKIIALNKKARFNYQIIDTMETGIILMGTEVKSLRLGKVSITEAYASEIDHHIYLINAQIQEYPLAKRFNHEPKRPRQLLMHKKQERKWLSMTQKKGVTLVPLSLYFNEKGKAKLELGMAKGKDKADKRETIKERDWNREKARILKGE